MQKFVAATAVLGALAFAGTAALAEDMTGVTSDSIKIGQTIAYSGPAAPYGTLGRAMSAYFDTVNRAGGVDGHKIIFISRDDVYTARRRR